MPKAKKLPSGSWRVRAYSHTDPSGKKIYESFTAPSKKEAELMAAQFSSKKERRERNNLTVGEAILGYIEAKNAVLSPSTIRSYHTMCRNSYNDIQHIRISKLNALTVQQWVSGLSATHLPKGVKNAYGLLTASLKLAGAKPDLDAVTLPVIPKKRPPSPSDQDVAALYGAATIPVRQGIALAAFASLRQGEACAVKYGDLDGNRLYIHADIIRGMDGWEYKEFPKTSDSVRTAILPEKVTALLGTGCPDDYVIGLTPGALYGRYARMCKKLGVSIRFHDLRHYYASIGAVLGIPDIYLASFGGWSQGSNVMKEVYQNKIENISDLYARKMGAHFDEILEKYDTGYDTENKKAAI